jgi:hypothetical protein
VRTAPPDGWLEFENSKPTLAQNTTDEQIVGKSATVQCTRRTTATTMGRHSNNKETTAAQEEEKVEPAQAAR